MLLDIFTQFETECTQTLDAQLPIPAYDYVLKCSHIFNLLDARGAISATERQAYILRVRNLAKRCCEAYLASVDNTEEEVELRHDFVPVAEITEITQLDEITEISESPEAQKVSERTQKGGEA